MVQRLLAQQLITRPLAECTVQDLSKFILDAFAEERYKSILSKTVESEVERLLNRASVYVQNGKLAIKFQ